MMENSETAASSGKERLWPVVLYFVGALALAGGIGLAVIGIPAVLSIFSVMGNNGLTIDELQALDMLKDLKGPLVPVELGALGWIAIFAPLGLLAWFVGRRRDGDDPAGAKDHAMFWSVAALMGVSLALLFYFSDAVSCALFVIAGGAIAAWLHGDFVERNFSRARNASLIALLGALSGGIGYRSWLMAAVPILVFGVIGFAVLLVHDVQRLRGAARSDPAPEGGMLAALGFYLSLAGIAVSIAGLAG